MDDVLQTVRNSSILLAAIAVSCAAALLVGCAPAQPTGSEASPSAAGWDPQAFLDEDSRQGAELLGIDNPPDVGVVRFVDPIEQDNVWQSCLRDAGFDLELAPGGGFLFPDEQPKDLMESMDLAIYICWEKYPVDPKFRAPETTERLKWMYDYTTTEFLDCLRQNGTPYEGEVPSEQVYIDSGGDWSPFTAMVEQYDLSQVQLECPQVPDEYWEQSFW